jgi:UDP-N-acetyl-D-glucosamine dehydrogenase
MMPIDSLFLALHVIHEKSSSERSSTMAVLYERLLSQIESKSALVGILGLGYVGLPLAKTFADEGFRVLGFDTDQEKIRSLTEGISYIGQVTGGHLRHMGQNGFRATGDLNRLGEPDALLMCVPTPLTDSREPDLSYVVQSARAISSALRPGQLIVLESTTYPGTTRELVLPNLERTGLATGRDYFLGYSPERQDPGNEQFTTADIPKVVSGIDEPIFMLRRWSGWSRCLPRRSQKLPRSWKTPTVP